MATFQYRARGQSGDLIVGRLEAETADAVAGQLINSGITPVQITAVTERGESLETLWRRLGGGQPGAEDLIMFARQMYSLVKAGIPLSRSISGLAQSSRNAILQAALRDVSNSLEAGRDLASSLARHGDIFSPLFISIVRVGENSGKLEDAFERISAYLALDRDIYSRIKRALRYPLFVILAIVAAVTIIVLFVIPKFSAFYAHVHMTLPLPTRLILGISDFAVANWPWMLAAIGATALFGRGYLRTDRGRYNWDRLKLRLPVVGAIVSRSVLARFARAFAIGYRSGVPLVQSLNLVSRAVGNEFIARRILQMRQGVERGESLTRTAATTGIFTPVVMQMLGVGEETGNVADMLDEVAAFYEREVDYDLDTLSTAIEPILLLILGFMVLILALGVFLPMWDLAANATHL